MDHALCCCADGFGSDLLPFVDLVWACWERLLKQQGRYFVCAVNLINLGIMKHKARVPWKNFFCEAFLMSLNMSQEVVVLNFFLHIFT